MTDTALGTELRRVNVFAKLTPEHKARIVSLLRREGHCVGYMGDGVNDLPAMHASEIAISASTGSEAVRQSADVMLTHKNLDVLLRVGPPYVRAHIGQEIAEPVRADEIERPAET